MPSRHATGTAYHSCASIACLSMGKLSMHRRRRRCADEQAIDTQATTQVRNGRKATLKDYEGLKTWNQARGGPREAERNAGRQGRSKRRSVCAMRKRAGGRTAEVTGGEVTCSDCHSQMGQCTGPGRAASAERAVCWEVREEAASIGSGRACECASAPNVLKNTYSSDTKAASLRFRGEVSDTNRLPGVGLCVTIRQIGKSIAHGDAPDDRNYLRGLRKQAGTVRNPVEVFR
jgi:hypothetical protein